MPLEYLTLDTSELSNGFVSASYLTTDLQTLYNQSMSDADDYFGNSPNDVIEFSLYNSSQELLQINNIVPTVSYSVLHGEYLDVNNELQSYRLNKPFTNILNVDNNVLLNVRSELSQLDASAGLYYGLYNFTRYVAGNPDYKLVIKEISPSRTEIRFSLAFNHTKNPTAELEYKRISAFSQKKYLLLDILTKLESAIDSNEISNTYNSYSDQSIKDNTIYNLGFNNSSELLEFILSIYSGIDKVFTYVGDTDEILIEESKKVNGIARQLKNFIYKYNDTEFSEEELLEAFKSIVTKISQDKILEKTSLNTKDLESAVEFFVGVIYDLYLQDTIKLILKNYTDRFYGLFKNALNFGDGNLIKILNHSHYLNTDKDLICLQVKLSDALPYEYSLKTVCWVTNISIAPIYVKINLYEINSSKKVYLNGVNFDVDVNTTYSSTDAYVEKYPNTIEAAKQSLKNKINELYIDFTDFNNFIIYSSAELRSKIAKNKIVEYNALEINRNALLTSANAAQTLTISSSLASDYSDVVNKQISLLNSFDDYESYIFYNSASIDKFISDGIEYDKQNTDSLISQLPEYIQNDVDSSDYVIFTSMVGHFFDNILLYIKKFPKVYPIENDNHYPKNFLDELLNSFNWKTDNFKFQDSSLTQYYFNNLEATGSYSSSYFDYGKTILDRFANNLPYIYKTKGTATSFELLKSIFGIDSSLIELREYGSFGTFVNQDQFFEFDDVVYLTKYTDTQYISFDCNLDEYTYIGTGEFSASASAPVTKSYSEQFNGINAFECIVRSDKQDYAFGSKIPVVKKMRNGKIDWQLYIKKSQHPQTGKFIWEITPNEASITSSISSEELPIFNGNIYSILLNREIIDGYTYDVISETSASSVSNLTFTSSNGEKYVPYEYKLLVNQYEGTLNNFTSKTTKNILYSQNKYFSSGSYFVGNYSGSSNFVGNIDKIKLFKIKISDDTFKEHSYNINSISTEDKANTYSNLYYLWSFDTPINLWNSGSGTSVTVSNQNEYYTNTFSAHNFVGEYISPYPNCTPVMSSSFPYQFEKVNLKQSINISKYGPNYKNNTKIDKLTETAVSTFVPYDNSTSTNDLVGSDSNVIGFYINPYRYLEDKIEDFLGKDGVINDIGDPKYLNDDTFPSLLEKQQNFRKLNKKYIYPQEFYTTYKFYVDFSIFDQVKQLIPNRATLKRGLLIEPSLLEKPRFKYLTSEFSQENTLSQSYIQFDNSISLTGSFIDVYDDTIDINTINVPKQDTDTRNFSQFIIQPEIDNRDYIYSKYGTSVDVYGGGVSLRSLYSINVSDTYYVHNNVSSSYVKFTTTHDKVITIGSGSAVTGSTQFQTTYTGDYSSGYSRQHISKKNLIGSRQAYRAISSSYSFYTYIKGRNSSETTINRRGVANQSSPIITIPGYINLELSSSTFPAPGYVSGSDYVAIPITASYENSSSLENWIYNL